MRITNKIKFKNSSTAKPQKNMTEKSDEKYA